MQLQLLRDSQSRGTSSTRDCCQRLFTGKYPPPQMLVQQCQCGKDTGASALNAQWPLLALAQHCRQGSEFGNTAQDLLWKWQVVLPWVHGNACESIICQVKRKQKTQGTNGDASCACVLLLRGDSLPLEVETSPLTWNEGNDLRHFASFPPSRTPSYQNGSTGGIIHNGIVHPQDPNRSKLKTPENHRESRSSSSSVQLWEIPTSTSSSSSS